MESNSAYTVDRVLLSRRGHYILGTLVFTKHHMVFQFAHGDGQKPREIWICYPIIERLAKSRGASWSPNSSLAKNLPPLLPPPSTLSQLFDQYTASHIRVFCKDFTYYSFDFSGDSLCMEVYLKLSKLVLVPRETLSILSFYAFDYKPNMLEAKLDSSGWQLYSAEREYARQNLDQGTWRISKVNDKYALCPSYPEAIVVPASVSDSVVKHAGKFRSKQRLPAVVYKHRLGENRNVIARCSQPLVGLNYLNRSLQDEKLVEEIFRSQEQERSSLISDNSSLPEQPQRNLIVDLRPVTNAVAQHALGAGTENIENYRGKVESGQPSQVVDKIFCNIDNIHVMRASLNKLTGILNDLDKFPVSTSQPSPYALLQQLLTKTQWLHRLSIILQSVDRIIKSVHLNNTNVLIHCSDGWDRTSQVSALAQLCLDPYYRTLKGFMVLVEKEWVSFGFKFFTRGDHGGCKGAANSPTETEGAEDEPMSQSSSISSLGQGGSGNTRAVMTSFLQRAASQIRNTASAATASASNSIEGGGDALNISVYHGSNEQSPIFHQFLDCVFQIYKQHPQNFEFNSRFLKRLLYHYYSCQYGTFLCDSEREQKSKEKVPESCTSAWDYFLSRASEFTNPLYDPLAQDVVFFNFSEVKWWCELYGRSDEEMNGLSNSLDRKFAQLGLGQLSTQAPEPTPVSTSPS